MYRTIVAINSGFDVCAYADTCATCANYRLTWRISPAEENHPVKMSPAGDVAKFIHFIFVYCIAIHIYIHIYYTEPEEFGRARENFMFNLGNVPGMYRYRSACLLTYEVS